MSTETQGISEERLREIEIMPDGPSPRHSQVIEELFWEVLRLKQRERDLLTAVKCAEGNYEQLYTDIKTGSYDRID